MGERTATPAPQGGLGVCTGPVLREVKGSLQP